MLLAIFEGFKSSGVCYREITPTVLLAYLYFATSIQWKEKQRRTGAQYDEAHDGDDPRSGQGFYEEK